MWPSAYIYMTRGKRNARDQKEKEVHRIPCPDTRREKWHEETMREICTYNEHTFIAWPERWSMMYVVKAMRLGGIAMFSKARVYS